MDVVVAKDGLLIVASAETEAAVVVVATAANSHKAAAERLEMIIFTIAVVDCRCSCVRVR